MTKKKSKEPKVDFGEFVPNGAPSANYSELPAPDTICPCEQKGDWLTCHGKEGWAGIGAVILCLSLTIFALGSIYMFGRSDGKDAGMAAQLESDHSEILNDDADYQNLEARYNRLIITNETNKSEALLLCKEDAKQCEKLAPTTWQAQQDSGVVTFSDVVRDGGSACLSVDAKGNYLYKDCVGNWAH